MRRVRRVRRVTVRCPVSAQTLAALLRGESAALESDENAARVLAVIRGDNPLGDLGLYRGVFEVGLGFEGFTPAAQAKPAAGRSGENTLFPTVTITTYLDVAADPGAVSAALDALLAAHPWEIPVIEVDDHPAQLLLRDRH